MEIKLNDVYRFRYNEFELERSSRDLNWCFDGQLVVKKGNNGLYLEDTYWTSDNRCFTLEEALRKGVLEFVCNLDDVEECKEDPYNYYDDEDIFNLSYQHGCYKKIMVRKDAKKSKEKMKEVLEYKIAEAERQLKSVQYDIDIHKNKLKELENGNLDIYIW